MSATPDPGISCIEIVELVTAYLEDQLSAVERTRFETHLTLCTGCDRYLEQIRETIARTGSLVEDDVAPDTMARLRAAFRDWGGPGPG